MTNSVYIDDPERAREKSEADEHMHRYVSDELKRFNDDSASGTFNHADEFEAKP